MKQALKHHPVLPGQMMKSSTLVTGKVAAEVEAQIAHQLEKLAEVAVAIVARAKTMKIRQLLNQNRTMLINPKIKILMIERIGSLSAPEETAETVTDDAIVGTGMIVAAEIAETVMVGGADQAGIEMIAETGHVPVIDEEAIGLEVAAGIEGRLSVTTVPHREETLSLFRLGRISKRRREKSKLELISLSRMN